VRRKEFFRITRYARTYDRQEGKFHIDIRYKTKTEVTPRTIGVAEAFGIGVDEYREHVVYDNVTIKIGPRDVVYITGESGSGKSVLLKALEKDLGDEAINIDNIQPDPDRPIVETVGENLEEALELLSRVGLNDAFLFIRRYKELSDGQRYRYRIAKLIESGKQFWIMDEFCATLDRDTAKIVAFNVQKQARRAGRAVIAATTHTDLFDDLAPTVHIHKGWGKRIEVYYYPDRLNENCSVTRDLRIEEGAFDDYKQLAEFHYRTSRCPSPHRTFTLKRGDELCGVIVYSHPPPNVFGRRKAWKGRYEQLKKEMITITRVVLHPKYRSIGLGAKLVKETLPMAGTLYVETIAVMAKYNPFFEKAGMQRIAETRGDQTIQQAITRLEEIGFKAYALTSRETNLNYLKNLKPKELLKIKETLLNVSQGYYKRLKASGKAYVQKEEYRNFISDASVETLSKVISRLAVLAQTKVYLLWKNPRIILSTDLGSIRTNVIA